MFCYCKVTKFDSENDDPQLFPKLVGEAVVRGWALENIGDKGEPENRDDKRAPENNDDKSKHGLKCAHFIDDYSKRINYKCCNYCFDNAVNHKPLPFSLFKIYSLIRLLKCMIPLYMFSFLLIRRI